MLYAAFLAEQGVALCIVADPAFAGGASATPRVFCFR